MADFLRGKTVHWTYEDGPTAGKAFTHTFGQDGKVSWTMDGSKGSPQESQAEYQTAQLAPAIQVVSYLAPSGWALTSVLDQRNGTLVSVASNEKELFVQNGTHSIPANPPTRARSRSNLASTRTPSRTSRARSLATESATSNRVSTSPPQRPGKRTRPSPKKSEAVQRRRTGT
jgi:MoaF N-terminal domain